MICVLKSDHINEPFHRQDFFFFNYAYQGSYSALSYERANLITVHENECYIGQPFNGYALKSDPSRGEIIIIGVLIKKETFFREYLSTISSAPSLLNFFLEPQSNRFSDSFIRLSFADNSFMKHLLELMVREYAYPQADSQQILKPLVLSLFMLVAREYREETVVPAQTPVIKQMELFIAAHIEDVTLDTLARNFSYHPNYVSYLLRSQTGRTFSEILLSERMERASVLLKRTTLSIEEISAMVGYPNSSNFYKAFKKYYGTSPREYKS